METLYSDNIETKPIDFDFSEGYGETWEVIEPDFDEWSAERCIEYANDNGLVFDDDDSSLGRETIIEALESIGIACYDDESTELLREAYLDSVTAGDLADIEAWREACRDDWQGNARGEPMMNYYYPIKLRGDEREAASMLDKASLPLTLVTIGEETALALTGGGMDLSAEICRAYILLGQRPPVHFCRVPRMAGEKYDRRFLELLIESCQIEQNWAQNTIDDLQRIGADPDYSKEPASFEKS